MIISQNHTKKQEKRPNGFTLVEILTVLGVLCALATAFLLPLERWLRIKDRIFYEINQGVVHKIFTQIQEDLEQAEKIDGTNTMLTISLADRKITYTWSSNEKPSGLLRHEKWHSQPSKTKTFLPNTLISMNLKGFTLAENQTVNILTPHDFRSLSANFQGFHLTLHAHHPSTPPPIKFVHIFLLPGS